MELGAAWFQCCLQYNFTITEPAACQRSDHLEIFLENESCGSVCGRAHCNTDIAERQSANENSEIYNRKASGVI